MKKVEIFNIMYNLYDNLNSGCSQNIKAITNIELDATQSNLIYDVYSIQVNRILEVFDNPVEVTYFSVCSSGDLPVNTNQDPDTSTYIVGGCSELTNGIVDEIIVDLYIENNVLYYKKLLVELIEATNNSTKIISQIDNNCYPYYCKNGSCVNDGQHQVSDTTYAFFGQCIGNCTPLSSSSSSMESSSNSSTSNECTTSGTFWCKRSDLGSLGGDVCECINTEPVPPGRCSYSSVAECQPHCYLVSTNYPDNGGGNCLYDENTTP